MNYDLYIDNIVKTLEQIDCLQQLRCLEEDLKKKVNNFIQIIEQEFDLINVYEEIFCLSFDFSNTDLIQCYEETVAFIDITLVNISRCREEDLACKYHILEIEQKLINSRLPEVLFFDHNSCQETLFYLSQIPQNKIFTPKDINEMEIFLMSKLNGHIGVHLDNLLSSSRLEVNELIRNNYSNQRGWDTIKCLDFLTLIEALNLEVERKSNQDLVYVNNIINSPESSMILSLSNISLQEIDEAGQLLLVVSERSIDKYQQIITQIFKESIQKLCMIIKNSTFLSSIINRDILDELMNFNVEFSTINNAITIGNSMFLELKNFISMKILEIKNTYVGYIDSFLFIGKEAQLIKNKINISLNFLEEQLCYGCTSLSDNTNLFSNGLTYLDGLLQQIFSTYFEILDMMETKISSVEEYFDIWLVYEDSNKKPIGVGSFLYGSTKNFLIENLLSISHVKNRYLTVTFPVGVMQKNEFFLNLTPDSIFGDWVKWCSGGFLVRDRPNLTAKIPTITHTNFTRFLSVNVIKQWSGSHQIKDFIESISNNMGQNIDEMEYFFCEIN